ncbi:TetR family transcriptional regulator [Micromonospora yangpuensis]|uniref:Transcriptional regulator, TetR family n=1 Tax=Micromonospora yangpuensis TaxID=683228 RepID=A0A1C6URZ0_9ACTN|nr:TetR family transcriptional regulator [Micromonospora yangpuensis]GGM06708.1 TetR family transcriptional regulator [Micromonospora yangpuensis]SCL56746.1 transcriptional regulator, TetR family [Micromonospora yangpuensis]
MDTAPPDDTRSRILRAALERFAEQGYQRTSLREIADRLRLTKAAILYHFPTKEHLVLDLVEPMLTDLEGLLVEAGRHAPERARWVLVEGWIDTMLRHRRSLGMLFHDINMLSHGPTFQRLMRIAMRANELVAGPNASRRDQVRAVQAIAMCSDPVVFFDDVPDEVLRADMLDGPRRLFADDPPARTGGAPAATDGPPAPADGAPRSRAGAAVEVRVEATGAGDGGRSATRPGPGPGGGRRRSGRPPAMSPAQVATARRMYADGAHSADEIAAHLGVSRATVYRHLAAG